MFGIVFDLITSLFMLRLYCPSLCQQDSLVDELSTCNESLATEPSFIDENLVFNESKRVPFFKVKNRIEDMFFENSVFRCRQSVLELS